MYIKREQYTVNILPNRSFEILGEWKDDAHDLKTRIVFAYDTFSISSAEVRADNIPFDICQTGLNSIKNLIGVQLSPGFNKAVNERLTGEEGCMHLAELVSNSARALIQALSREKPEWADPKEYYQVLTIWGNLYKNKCVYFAQPEFERQNPEEIQAYIKNK